MFANYYSLVTQIKLLDFVFRLFRQIRNQLVSENQLFLDEQKVRFKIFKITSLNYST